MIRWEATAAEIHANPVATDTVNYILGTQTIGVKYQFTEETSLVETAKRIEEMGSNLLKFSMSRRYKGEHYHLPPREDIRSLADLAQKEPSVKAVLGMSFDYYHIWVSSFGPSRWQDGFDETERENVYTEIYTLAKHLLQTYKATAKTFYLGHWEGDWLLLAGKKDPSPVAIKGMIDWLNTRQKAIDDAKRDAGATGVSLYHYTEVNLVQKGMNGEKCLVNSVLPLVGVDYVSYSSYDTINPNKGDVQGALHRALDFIESMLPSKEGLSGKRVFIGEYGFPLASAGSPKNQDRYSRDVCIAALEWGCPFVLYWELYCNENPAGKHRGLWLIDDRNQKQPFYYTMERYYEQMKEFVAGFEDERHRLPTDSELRKRAIEILR